jgi:hypothetical protein
MAGSCTQGGSGRTCLSGSRGHGVFSISAEKAVKSGDWIRVAHSIPVPDRVIGIARLPTERLSFARHRG